MAKLNTSPNIDDPDEFYNRLIQLHENLSSEQSRKLNARLLLLLANHIGDAEVLNEALKVAAGERTRESGLNENKEPAEGGL